MTKTASWRRHRYTLAAPPEYWNATDEAHDEICNGCGAAGAKFDFVPDTAWGLHIGPACDVHDWRYCFGETERDRTVADMEFLNNCLRLIDKGSRWLKPLRRRRALKYYEAVRSFGGPAYWAGKDGGPEEGSDEDDTEPQTVQGIARIDGGPSK